MEMIPDEMTVVLLDDYTDASLRVATRPVPAPGKNEVLVKMAASPINPSDLAFLMGRYRHRPQLPAVPGFEGSGTVVAAGPGLMGRYLMGKRVACTHGGTGAGLWADYAVVGVSEAFPLDKGVGLELGAMSVINPLTAMAFLSICRQGGHKAIVQTAAASGLGQMVNRLAQGAGIGVINVVRREEQVAQLREQGATYVLNSSAADFDASLRSLSRRHRARLAFDAVAGEMTNRLLEALPTGSRVLVFGGLSLEPAQADPEQLIFGRKSVEGFWLTTWAESKNALQLLLAWRRAQKMMATHLHSEIRARYPLREAPDAVATYGARMTGGKILLVPGMA